EIQYVAVPVLCRNKNRRAGRFRTNARWRLEMGEAATGAHPHRSIRIFEKGLIIDVVPNQPIVDCVLAPGSSVEHLNSLILAYPDPAPLVHAQEEDHV